MSEILPVASHLQQKVYRLDSIAKEEKDKKNVLILVKIVSENLRLNSFFRMNNRFNFRPIQKQKFQSWQNLDYFAKEIINYQELIT